jgi:hypothetical protein
MTFKINNETPAAKLGYGTLPKELRGEIKGTNKGKCTRSGGDVTNAKYAEEHGITKRQASKQRRGY